MTRRIPQQKRAKERREAVLQAAREVISEVGRDRFTTDAVAERAGCSIGTVYNYFRDRVDILDELYPNRTEGLDGLGSRYWNRNSIEFSQ